MESLTCIIIGEGNIALTCLHLLQDNGIKVKAVFTNTPEMQSFCEQIFIETFPRRTHIDDVIQNQSFDYLFSINNPTILSDTVLLLARKLSINYHDSLLPSYAGVHATSWAIINDEKKHGVSWHVMEPGIDTGDILQSQSVEINDTDSVFSLNMKCVEAAIKAFNRLIPHLQDSKFQPSPQDFSKRSYYGLYETPPNLGVLDFNQGRQKTYDLARALEFGAHDNRLGSPKIRTPNGQFLLVTKIKKHENHENLFDSDNVEMKNPRPGTVLHCHDNVVYVATEPGMLSITVSELDGRHLTPNSLSKHSVEVGVRLVSAECGAVNDAMTVLPKKEQFWRQKMKSYEPTTLFIQKLKAVPSALDNDRGDIKSIDIMLPELKAQEYNSNFTDFIATSFIAFVARTNCTSSVHLGLAARTEDISSSFIWMYSETCPGVFKFNLSAAANETIAKNVQALHNYKKGKTFLLDMFYRYPELRQMKRTPHHNLVIGFENDNLTEKQRSHILSDSNILIVVGLHKISVSYFDRPNGGHSHVEDLLRHFPTFLTSLSSGDSSMTLLDVNLISTLENETLYKVPSITMRDEQENDLMPIFRQVCSSRGDATAVRTTDAKVTYAQLLDEVCSLATLISSNLPQTYRTDLKCMALHMTNSIAYVVSVLSAMMCNIPFMPVPENTPIERMAFMLKDARATVVLTTKEIFNSGQLRTLSSNIEILVEMQTSFGNLVMLLVETDDNDDLSTTQYDGLSEVYSFTSLSDMDVGDSDDVSLEPDCCYVMYTSGSTGRPKGVQVKVPGVLNMAQAQIDCWDIGKEDTIAQFASIGFDATISEIFTALLSGACLAVLNEKERLGREFADAILSLRVTTITLPPSVLNIYGPNDFPTLKKVVTAGEACIFSTAIRWTEHSDVRFFNAYGPTETTVCATVHEYHPGESEGMMHLMDLPIGKAINGVQVYLFDDFLKPVPPGVVGEIYIGGQGLSGGYIGHANKRNNERFIANPLSPHSTLYKTGDHAIQDGEGCLTYIGRLDDQVKIRGQRVDLNEIEQALLQHPKVDMAVVVKHQSKTSPDANIAAFVAPLFVLSSELREHLARILPCYMMPTYIKQMDVQDFLLTPNGKIDRKKLERDQSVVKQSTCTDSSHLTPVQLSVVKLWCRVLQIEESHAYNLHKLSTFSEIGGNSLHMVLLQRTIEDEFKINLTFAEIGGASTVEDFTELINPQNRLSKPVNDTLSEIDLKKHLIDDSILDMQILTDLSSDNIQVTPHSEPKNMLLSGSTGFLGAFLLSEIFQQSDARVYCMVRETTESGGYRRIVANMRKYKLWNNEYESRITVVLSELSKANLGIEGNKYNALSLKIDVVFMNAAKMNFNTDYFDHKKSNVDSVVEFIKFTMTGKKKFLFSTSSLAVFLFPPPSQSSPQDHSSSHTYLNKSKSSNFTNNALATTGNNSVSDKIPYHMNEYGITSHGKCLRQSYLSDFPMDRNQSKEFTDSPSLLDIVNTDTSTNISREMTSFQNNNINASVKDTYSSFINENGCRFKWPNSTTTRKEKMAKRIVYDENDTIQDPSCLSDGYGQSKWVSEKLVLQALNHVPGGAVFRPARVSGHSQTGVGPTNDLFSSLIKGIRQLGYAPDLDFPFDLMPVDCCAMGMIEITLQICRGGNGTMPRAYHLFNPLTMPFRDIFEGEAVQCVPLEEWREKVKRADRENPLVPLIPYFLSSFWDRTSDWPDFNTKLTESFLSADCKKRLLHSRSLLEVYKNFFKECK